MNLQELSTEDHRYKLLVDYIKTYLPEEWIIITSVKRVTNKYLKSKFLIKKTELKQWNEEQTKLPHSPTVGVYIHATDQSNVESILRGNLDWRRVRNMSYGPGVSLTKYPVYARQYCKNVSGGPPFLSAFIVLEVLDGNAETVGVDRSIFPSDNIHTYRDTKGQVLVKFDDNTFNPLFIVYYEDHACPRIANWNLNGASDMLDALLISEDQDSETRYTAEFLKDILQRPYQNEFDSSLASRTNQLVTQAESSIQPDEAMLLSGDSERTEAAKYDKSESNEQPLQTESCQTDILSDIVSSIPSTWSPIPISSYKGTGAYYFTTELHSYSPEYQLVAAKFESLRVVVPVQGANRAFYEIAKEEARIEGCQLYKKLVKYGLQEIRRLCVVKYIIRVQNPFQLALFKIAREEARAEGYRVYEGYHTIYKEDLYFALKYTLDYRRYKLAKGLSVEQDDYKQPKFYNTIANAVLSFPRNPPENTSKLILVCDILSQRSDQIQSRTQTDYLVNYVVCFE